MRGPDHSTFIFRISPDLQELAEILDKVSVGMIPLRYRRGCRTFQTPSFVAALAYY